MITYRIAWELVETVTRYHGWNMSSEHIRQAALAGTGRLKKDALDEMMDYLRDYEANILGAMQDGAGI